jgi:TonB family protein
MRIMSIFRKAGPWAISAAVHGLLAAAAIVTVTGITAGKADSSVVKEAVYTVAIQPGGGEWLAGDLPADDGLAGIPSDEAVSTEEAPLDGVPEFKLTGADGFQGDPSPTSTSPGPTTIFRNGTSQRIRPRSAGGVAGGGGSSGTGIGTGTGSGAGQGDGKGAGIEATPLETPPPVYPEEARRANQQGIVMLEVRIDVQGRVESARVAGSSGSVLLDTAAVATVLKWKYKPATVEGRPHPSVRKVKFVFRLE